MQSYIDFISCAVLIMKLFLCRCSDEVYENSEMPVAANDPYGFSERTDDIDGDMESTTFASSTQYSTVEGSISTTEEAQEKTTEAMDNVYKQSTIAPERNKTYENIYIIKDICANFKYTAPIVLNKMVDLWQTAYYSAPQKVPCYKMFIRKLTMKEKQSNRQLYGNFDDAVEWEDCNLEIRSSLEVTKHYLQGCERGHGVLENVIIATENEIKRNFILKPESPDQWLVIQNLLLKRNCDTGDIIVFSRVPHKPRADVIKKALKSFGETGAVGKFICGDQPPIKKKPHQIDEEVNETI